MYCGGGGSGLGDQGNTTGATMATLLHQSSCMSTLNTSNGGGSSNTTTNNNIGADNSGGNGVGATTNATTLLTASSNNHHHHHSNSSTDNQSSLNALGITGHHLHHYHNGHHPHQQQSSNSNNSTTTNSLFATQRLMLPHEMVHSTDQFYDQTTTSSGVSGSHHQTLNNHHPHQANNHFSNFLYSNSNSHSYSNSNNLNSNNNRINNLINNTTTTSTTTSIPHHPHQLHTSSHINTHSSSMLSNNTSASSTNLVAATSNDNNNHNNGSKQQSDTIVNNCDNNSNGPMTTNSTTTATTTNTTTEVSQSSDVTDVVGADQQPAEEQEPEPEIDIVINNVVCSFSVRCHLNLRKIALAGCNVEYRRENGMVTMKLRRPYTTASVWSSGRITCTGATSEDQAKVAARRYARCLQKLGFKTRFHNFRVVNVLGTCSMPWAIKIVNFSERYKKAASYEPELHPGVTYKLEEPKATLKIFSTGSITVTASSVAKVQAAIEHIFPLVYEFRKKRSPADQAALQLKHANNAAVAAAMEAENLARMLAGGSRKRKRPFGKVDNDPTEDNIFVSDNEETPTQDEEVDDDDDDVDEEAVDELTF